MSSCSSPIVVYKERMFASASVILVVKVLILSVLLAIVVSAIVIESYNVPIASELSV